MTSHSGTTRAVPPQEGPGPRSSDRVRASPAAAHDRQERFGPSWFAAVTGTGIVADAAATLPPGRPGLRDAATVVWAGAALLLIVLTVGYLGQRTLRAHAGDAVPAQFFGAPPMALLTVGAGTLLLGRRLVGERGALDVSWA